MGWDCGWGSRCGCAYGRLVGYSFKELGYLGFVAKECIFSKMTKPPKNNKIKRTKELAKYSMNNDALIDYMYRVFHM